MSLQNLIVKFQEKGFKELDSKLTQIQNKTKNVDIKEPKGLNKFSSGLDVAKGKLNSLIPGINKASLGFSGLAVAMGGVVQRLYSMTKAWASESEAIILSAQKAGLATKEFQALEQAGKEYNFTQANVIAGMAKLRQQAIKTGDTRTTAELFRETAEMVKNANSETEALNIAVERLGRRNGPEMIAMLKGGSAELDKYIEKTEKIRIDDKTQASVLAFQDVMNNAGVAMQGIKVTFMKDIIEPMITFAEKLWGMIIPFLEAVMSIVTPIIRLVMFFVNQVMKELAVKMQVVSTILDSIGLVIDIAVTGLEMLLKLIMDAVDETIEWFKQFKFIERILKSIGDTWDKIFGKGGKKDREAFREALARRREEYGFGRPVRTPKTKDTMVVDDNLIIPDVAVKGSSRRGGGSGTPEMVAILIHFKNEFIMFARRLLAIQEHGRTLTGRTVASNANIALTVNVDATGAGSPGAVGQAVADNVQAVLRDILTSNRQAVTAIQNHEQTVKDITTTKPDERQARLTPSINPVMQPLG